MWGAAIGEKMSMRPSFIALIVSAMLIAAPAAIAAPTCQDINGSTIRCGVEGAMPVGWTLPLQQRLERQMPGPIYSNANALLEAICVLGVFFALMALLPEFDGWRAGDWGKQEDDDKER
jgi:hypothetical protein